MVEEKIDVDKSLRDIENFLRNNIMYILKNQYGNDWEKHLGVTEERLDVKVNIKMHKKLKIKMYKKCNQLRIGSEVSESIFNLSFKR